MLELSAAMTVILLIARELFAIDPARPSQRRARWAGWGALPFLLIFAIIATTRVLGYAAAGVG